MPVQLDLLGAKAGARSIWEQLPTAAKDRVCALFAELLIVAVSGDSPNAEVAHDESHEDPAGPSRS